MCWDHLEQLTEARNDVQSLSGGCTLAPPPFWSRIEEEQILSLVSDFEEEQTLSLVSDSLGHSFADQLLWEGFSWSARSCDLLVSAPVSGSELLASSAQPA